MKKFRTTAQPIDLTKTSVYGYVRVSSEGQATNTSLDDQERRIAGAAQVLGRPLARVFRDPAVSGGVPLAERPEGSRLLADLRPGDVVIAAKLDRLFRNAADALATAQDWNRRGVKLILLDMGLEPVTDGGIAKLLFTVLAALAEMERERIAERMRDGRAAKRSRGGHTGGNPPFGYRAEGAGRQAVLVPVPVEQEALATAREAREAGMSLRRIEALVRMKHGVAVSYEALRRALAKEGVS